MNIKIPRNTGKYPRVKTIPKNTPLYIWFLLPDPTPTSYPVFVPIPDPILKNPTRLALVSNCYSWKTWWSSHDKYLSHHLYGAAQNDLKTLVVVNHGFNFVGNYHRPIWQTQVVGLSIILVIDTELFPPKFNQVDVNIADTGSLGDTIILSKPESLKNVMNWL